jgi:predicted O-methyltransferase YrrM
MIDETLLRKLNLTVIESGVKMEGNLFYHHHTVPGGNLFPAFESKRKNLQLLAKKFNSILEIGFNAGHSAALMLESNRKLHLTSVDIGDHKYVVPCSEVIQEAFPGRHTLIVKNSNLLTSEELKGIKAIIIDGGHDFDVCYRDIALCIEHCKPKTVVVIDDYNFSGVRAAFDNFAKNFTRWDKIEGDETQAFFQLN